MFVGVCDFYCLRFVYVIHIYIVISMFGLALLSLFVVTSLLHVTMLCLSAISKSKCKERRSRVPFLRSARCDLTDKGRD